MQRSNTLLRADRSQISRHSSWVGHDYNRQDWYVGASRSTDTEVLVIEGPNRRQIKVTFIPGFLDDRAYIVSEDLNSDKADTIIELVWQLEINRIITLSCVDDNMANWDGYWPAVAGETKRYGEYTLSLLNTFIYADYITRVFRLSKGMKSLSVYHFQFTTWRDKGVPMYGPSTLINFVKRVHSVDSMANGPAIVHSVCGGCRSGTYIICDIMIQELAINGRTDTIVCVDKVARRAPFVLPNADQMDFLDDVIIEELKIDSSSHPARLNAPELLNMLQDIDTTDIPQLAKEFEVLCKGNHGFCVQTNDEYKPLPTGFTYVDSFRRHNQFIITWTPNRREWQQELFWKCVYDHQIAVITMLDHLDKYGHKMEYWPNRGTKNYGTMQVTIRESSYYSAHLLVRTFDVKNTNDGSSNPHIVVHYQLKGWKHHQPYPQNEEEYLFLVSEICRLQQWRRQPVGTNLAEIIVHCRDGRTRSALFCAACYIVEDIDVRCEVNPLLAATVVSRNNKQFFQSLRDYQWLYQIARAYLEWKKTSNNEGNPCTH